MKKLILSFCIVLTMVGMNVTTAMADEAAAVKWKVADEPSTALDGVGTADDPYKIQSCEDWVFFATQVNAKEETYVTAHYRLMVDLNFENREIAPVGMGASGNDPKAPFSGVFDGNNKKIYNIFVRRFGDGSGLFGYIGNNTSAVVIANIGIESGKIFQQNVAWRVGLVGNIDNQKAPVYILNCYNKAEVYNAGNATGGIVGNVDASSFSVVVKNTFATGGLFINNNYSSYGGVNGGLVGAASDSKISSSYAAGDAVAAPRKYDGTNPPMPNATASPAVDITKKLVGSGSTNVTNSYYESGLTDDETTTEGGPGKKTDDMKLQAFADLLNEGQGEAWLWAADKNNGYPYLNNFYGVIFTEKENVELKALDDDAFFVPGGSDYQFTMAIDPTKTGTLTVKANGVELIPDGNGIYTIENILARQVVTIEGTLVDRTYTLTAEASDFDDEVYGYSQPAAKAITITSTGNSDATITAVSLDTEGANYFTIVDGTTAVTAGGTNTTYTVVPNASLGADTYKATITVTYDGGATAVTGEISFTVNKANQASLVIDAVADKTFGDAAFDLATTGGNGTGAVTYELVSGNATVTPAGNVTITGTGSIVVKATKAGDDNYNGPITSVEQTIVVNKANQASLVIDAVADKTFGDAAFDLATTGGNGTGAVTYELVSGNATVTPAGNVTITGTGNIVVKATKAGDANYNAVESAELTIVVNKANQTETLAITAVPAKTYGDAAFDLTTTGGNGTGAVTYELVSGNATVTPAGNVTITGTGSIVVKASKAGDDNYNGPVESAELTITANKAKLTATYAGESITEGDTPELKVNVTGFVNGEDAGTAAGYTAPVINNTNTDEGTYSLTPTGGAADNYDFVYVSGNLVIGPYTGIGASEPDGVEIYTTESSIVVTTPFVSTITVYTMNGSVIAIRANKQGMVEIPVSRSFTGIVRVECANGVTLRKVVK